MPIFSSTGCTIPSLSSSSAASRWSGNSSGLPCSEARSLPRCTASCAFTVSFSQRIAIRTPQAIELNGGRASPPVRQCCAQNGPKPLHPPSKTKCYVLRTDCSNTKRRRSVGRLPSVCPAAAGERRARTPVLHRANLCRFAWTLAFQRLFATYIDFDLLGLGFGLFGQLYLQHTFLVVGGNAFRVHRVGQSERASEAAILPFDPAVVLFFFILLELALAMHSQGVVFDAYVDVLLVNSRNFDLQRNVVLIFINVHGGSKARGGQGLVPALVERGVEEAIQAVLHAAELAVRIPTG